jgi:hypothetical protein
MGALHDDLCTFVVISAEFLEREMLQTNVVEKIKTHSYVQRLFFKTCAVYEIIRKNVGPDWP